MCKISQATSHVCAISGIHLRTYEFAFGGRWVVLSLLLHKTHFYHENVKNNIFIVFELGNEVTHECV